MTSSNRPRALIVDDQEIIRTLVQSILERCGFEVDSVSNAEEALRLWRPHHYALVSTDFDLGNGINGLSLAHLLLTEQPDARIYMYSGSCEAQEPAQRMGLRFFYKGGEERELKNTARQLAQTYP